MTQGRDTRRKRSNADDWRLALAAMRPRRLVALILLGIAGIAGVGLHRYLSPWSEASFLKSERERLHRGLAQQADRADEDAWALIQCPDVSHDQVLWTMEQIAAQHGRRPRVAVFTQWWPGERGQQVEGPGLLIVDDAGTHAFELRDGADPTSLPDFDAVPRPEPPSPGRLSVLDTNGLDAYLARVEAGDREAMRRLLPLVRQLHRDYLRLEGERSRWVEPFLPPIDMQALDRVGGNELRPVDREALVATLLRHIEFASEPPYFETVYPVFFSEHGDCAAWNALGNSTMDVLPGNLLRDLVQDGMRGELTPARVQVDVSRIDAFDGIRPPTLGARLDAILGELSPPAPDADAGEDAP